MHPLVRNLYKRVLHVGHDYPTGLDHVKQVWKTALQQTHCDNEQELRQAVAHGRRMVQEMIGVIQLKKYRAMKRRYDDDDSHSHETWQDVMKRLEEQNSKKPSNG